MKRWDLLSVFRFDEAQLLAAEGWDLVAVTETFETWENTRKGYQESSSSTTFYLKREKAAEGATE